MATDRNAAKITVVLMTRNRVEELVHALERLHELPEEPPIVVVDNGSSDGTSERVARQFPDVEVLTLSGNLGVEARNIAVRRVSTPYVAFNDDDSWWAPGSLARAVELFAAHPRLGAVAANILVEPGSRRDPISVEMENSPLTADPGVPGVPVLGFLACAAAVRTAAYEEVGGFERRLHFAGEEELLATDLTSHGWEVRFLPELTVHHQPSTARDSVWRARRGVRNALWTLWLRRPAGSALGRSVHLLRSTDPTTAALGLAQALRGLPWVLRQRRVVPAHVERQLRLLQPDQDRSEARRHVA